MISLRIFKIMSIFTYCIKIYAVAPKYKYLSQIDRLLRKAVKFGCIENVNPIEQVILEKDLKMWKDNI